MQLMILKNSLFSLLKVFQMLFFFETSVFWPVLCIRASKMFIHCLLLVC